MVEWAVVGLDNGGTKNNATVLDGDGNFLVDRLLEMPSFVHEGPHVAVRALGDALDNVLAVTGVARESIRAVGLDTPGPASAGGVISSKGSTNSPNRRGGALTFVLRWSSRSGCPSCTTTMPMLPRSTLTTRISVRTRRSGRPCR